MCRDKKICILTGGRLEEEVVLPFLEQHKGDLVICVDGALEFVDRLGLEDRVQYLVGDFDTVHPELLECYLRKAKIGEWAAQIIRHNPVKDETDTQLALNLAIKLKAREIAILGATGTRLDHVAANVHLLKFPLLAGIPAYLLDSHNKVYLKNQGFTIDAQKVYGPYISLIPLEGRVSSVTLRGFRYETRQISFPFEGGLGISNELATQDTASVEFTKGTFMVVEARD